MEIILKKRNIFLGFGNENLKKNLLGKINIWERLWQKLKEKYFKKYKKL